MKTLLFNHKDYKVYVERNDWKTDPHWIEDVDGNIIYRGNSYIECVKVCNYLQAKLDNARWLEEVKNYGRK